VGREVGIETRKHGRENILHRSCLNELISCAQSSQGLEGVTWERVSQSRASWALSRHVLDSAQHDQREASIL
jgi:hypothetical protein